MTDHTTIGQGLSSGVAMERDLQLGHYPVPLGHRLSDHPLLKLEAIAQLADSLPKTSVEVISGKRDIVAPGGQPIPVTRPSKAVLGIATNGCWMAVRNIEQNVKYRYLVEDLLDQMDGNLPEREGDMRLREAFIFLSSQGSVTSVHIDPENNALLQVYGSKEVNIGTFSDREVEAHEIQRYLLGGHRNLSQLPSSYKTFHLQPGQGVYIPPWQPHWVVNGPSYSISLSLGWRTELSQRHEYVHMVNGKLRRMGLLPRPVGESEWRDKLKASYVRGKRRLRKIHGMPEGVRNY